MKRAQQEVGERYDQLTRLDQREQSAATIGSSYDTLRPGPGELMQRAGQVQSVLVQPPRS
jgi:hypothetical protein